MAFNVQDIKSALVGGGARGNLFQVTFTNPVNGQADLKVPLMVRAAEIPAADMGTINVPYFGRTVKYAGDRTYGPWTVSIMNDEDFLIRNALEEWSNMINGFQNNLRQVENYKTDASVIQYAKNGEILRVYKFIGIFPSEISPMQLDWEPNDQIESFQCVFQYDYWQIDNSTTGDAGGI